ADVRRNGTTVRRRMRSAKRRGAEVVLFPECALSGYAGAQFDSFDGYPWDALAEETRRVRDLAAELELWTIVGSTHRRRQGKPTNCLYLIDPTGRVARRYDKCFLMPGDREHYAPGRRVVTHTIGGVKVGLAICFDFRFPELWRALLLRGCRVVFFASYLCSREGNRLMEQVAPATLTTRASENFLHVVAANACTGRQWLNARVHSPDGAVVVQAPWHRPHTVVHTIDLAADAQLYNPIGPLARRAARGQLHS
ncbi:MAG: carbon-nitrogen hydrolase family protein, partial [bacterium]